MDCPFCEGTGAQPCASSTTCLVCSGEGKLADDLNHEPRCERCNGSGKFPGTLNILCDVCHGTGKIPPEPFDRTAVFNEALDRQWKFPDEVIEYFTDSQRPLPDYLLGAQYLRIVSLESEIGWYEHPNFPNDFIRIGPNPNWEWEREAKASQPELRRTLVTLTEGERRDRDNKAAAAAVTIEQSSGPINDWVHKNPIWFAIINLVIGAALGVLSTLWLTPKP